MKKRKNKNKVKKHPDKQSLEKTKEEKKKLKKESNRDYIFLGLYVLSLCLTLWVYLFKKESDLDRIKSFIEMCKTLGQVSITVVIGYVALFAGLAAIYYKNDEENTKKYLKQSTRIAVYFILSSVLMLIYSFLPLDSEVNWALQDGVIPVVALFLVNQVAFVILNHYALQFVRKVVKKVG